MSGLQILIIFSLDAKIRLQTIDNQINIIINLLDANPIFSGQS